MVKMEPIVEKWYNYFEEGKIMGFKCQRCGSYIFPPVPVCEHCSGTNLTWEELSGEGTLLEFDINRFPDPPFAKFAPFAYGHVKLKEGPTYGSIIEGINLDNPKEEFEKLPMDVKAEVKQMEGYKIIAFRVKR